MEGRWYCLQVFRWMDFPSPSEADASGKPDLQKVSSFC